MFEALENEKHDDKDGKADNHRFTSEFESPNDGIQVVIAFTRFVVVDAFVTSIAPHKDNFLGT